MSLKHAENLKYYVLPLSLFPALFLLTVFQMIDLDLWFHMKAGQLILETGRFIYRDIFSYTAAGREWLYHEWLFGVLAFKVFTILGVNGLILGKAVILTLAFIIVYRDMMLRGVNPWPAAFVLFIAVIAARFRFTERPHIFKFLFIPLFIYLLDLYRLRGKNLLWLLPLIQLLWTNIHGSFILGPAIIAIYLFSEVISGRRREIKVLSIILLAVSLTTLINPYGLKLISFSLGFGEKKVLSSITEWAPTQITDFYGAFGLLFALGAASFLFKYRRIEIVDILLFGLFAYLSIKAIRFTALFSMAAAPIIAGNWGYLFSGLSLTPKRRAVIGIISIAMIVLLSVHEFRRNPILVFGLGQGAAFPEKAFDFTRKAGVVGNMYNSYAFGGYLIWRGYPERKVFVDGRAELYDREFQDSFILAASMEKWVDAINRYDINYAVIAYSAGGIDPIGKWITDDPKWVLIYWDEAARVYVRDIERNHGIIDRYAHRMITNPLSFNYDSLRNAVDKGVGDRLEEELKSDRGLNPENTKARYWLGMLYYEEGRKEEALSEWEEAARIRPDANLYSNIGNVFQEKGDYKKAIEYYKRAISADSHFAEAFYNLANVHEATGDKKEAAREYRRFIRYAGPEHADAVRALKERGIE